MVSQEKKGYSDSALQNRKRFTENDVQNQQFLQIPKFLFSNDFKGLSNDSRILYGLLKDKNELSIANNYVNENDEIYFNFSREDMMEMVGCSKPTIIKSINNLKEHFLLEEERIGLMKLNRIYLSYISDETYKMTKSSFIKAFNSIEVNKTTLEKVRESYSRLHISRSKDIACPEVKILRVLKSKYCVSRSKDIACPEVKILRGNKTVLNKTDFNKTYIYLSIIKRLNNLTNGHYEKEIELSIKEDRLIDLKYMIQELVESMLGYHDIKMKYEVTYFNDKAPILKSFRDVIVEYLLIPEELTKINNKMIPYELVADRLLAINHDTIILCVDKIFNLDKSVKNMNSYLLSTLYNSIVEDGATHHAIFNEKYYAN
nr:replication initiator protein A [Erysipelothrix anatis]